MTSEVYVPQRVMAVFAHPDDIEFSCAGTIALWADAGAQVRYVLLTSGQVGIKDLSISTDQAAAIRESEQLKAAAEVGVHDIIFLRYMDGMLENTLELRKQLVRQIRDFRPEVVICGDPTVFFVSGNDYINHPDHRAAATAAVDSIFPAAGMPQLFSELQAEGLTAHETRKVYIESWAAGTQNTVVDVSSTIERKITALLAHKSQMGDWPVGDMIRKWAAERGEPYNVPFAECFRVITLVSDEDWAKRGAGVSPEAANEPSTHVEA